jgi:hypothetical protein
MDQNKFSQKKKNFFKGESGLKGALAWKDIVVYWW